MDRKELTSLEDLPNIGPATAADFRRIGISKPTDLTSIDPYRLFDKLCKVTRKRHDPCVLDTFISAIRFMNGAPAKPWWAYTRERKAALARRSTVHKKT